jgi:hypothetical protein
MLYHVSCCGSKEVGCRILLLDMGSWKKNLYKSVSGIARPKWCPRSRVQSVGFADYQVVNRVQHIRSILGILARFLVKNQDANSIAILDSNAVLR